MSANRNDHDVWVLPLLAALLPALGALTAAGISMRLGLVETCNPLVAGCVSVSRAARYDLANIVFRALVLPGAVLQWLTWTLCRSWLVSLGSAARVRVIATTSLTSCGTSVEIRSTVTLPASTLEMSRMSLMIASRC